MAKNYITAYFLPYIHSISYPYNSGKHHTHHKVRKASIASYFPQKDSQPLRFYVLEKSYRFCRSTPSFSIKKSIAIAMPSLELLVPVMLSLFRFLDRIRQKIMWYIQPTFGYPCTRYCDRTYTNFITYNFAVT